MNCRWCGNPEWRDRLCIVCHNLSGENTLKDPFHKEFLSKKPCGCAFWREAGKIIEGKCKTHLKVK